ncbi:MAG: hypothetical protein U9Q27_03475 [Patescibacteria group bacterium]|nr:hypothetical protein [Patescibacteria group bacterium]
MSQKKEWLGIRQNNCVFQGKVIEDPQVVQSDVGDFIFMTLRTLVINRSPNGQVIESNQDIPLMVEPESSAYRAAKDFVMAGRKLLVSCQYKSWKSQAGIEHKFAINRLQLGSKPYIPQNNTTGLPE